jgi:hypothetical protein
MLCHQSDRSAHSAPDFFSGLRAEQQRDPFGADCCFPRKQQRPEVVRDTRCSSNASASLATPEPPAFRAMEVARSVKQGSRRGGKAGVRIRDPKQLFCIHPAMEAFAEEQLSLVLLVRSDRDADTDGHFCIPLVKRKGSGHGRRRRPWQGYGPCATIGRGGAARVVQRDARWWIRCSRSGSGRAMAGPLGRTR